MLVRVGQSKIKLFLIIEAHYEKEFILLMHPSAEGCFRGKKHSTTRHDSDFGDPEHGLKTRTVMTN